MNSFDLYLITDRKALSGRDLTTAVAAALEGGVRAVQLREKDLPDVELLRLARILRELTNRYGARLLINGRVDIALASDADGVHLGVSTPRIREAREQLGPERLIGFSTHSPTEIAVAEQVGADFITFGPVYPTPSKLTYGPAVGLNALQTACAVTNLPVYALGGVELKHLSAIQRTGAAGFACIRAVLCADSPSAAAHKLLDNWKV